MAVELYRFLQNQGYGGRKVCKELITAGYVALDGIVQEDYRALIEEKNIQLITINGKENPVWRLPLYLMLHKPTGYETSHKPLHHPSVFNLLPAQLLELGIQAIGRLDVDTSGLLLFTTDGHFVHQMSSPKKLIEKFYRIRLKHPATQTLVECLLAGVLLSDEQEIIRAQSVQLIDDYTLKMGITQGKYHQVKRMIAASSNRVEALHRVSIGNLSLGELKTGEWRLLLDNELADYRTAKS